MMKHEFEELAGYEVTTEAYNNIIEPMYMATTLSKQEFVKCVNRKQFEIKKEKTVEQVELERKVKEQINDLKKDIQYYEATIEMYKLYYADDHDKAWKANIQNYRMYIKATKAEIYKLKWILG